MNTKSLIYYALALVSMVIAVVVFFKSVDWRSLVILIFGAAAVLLFRQGMEESKKK